MTTRGHHGIILNEASVPWDGFPTVLGVTTYGNATATNTHSISLPSGSAGDLILMHVAHSTTTSLTVPSGWTSLSASVNNPFGGPRSSWIYKVATGSEGASQAFNTSGVTTVAAQLHRFQVTTFQSVPELATAANVAANTTPNPPSLTPTWGSANTLWIASYSINMLATTTVYPLPDNQVTNAGTDPTNPRQIGSCTSKTATASLDPSAFTISVSLANLPQTVAIRPA